MAIPLGVLILIDIALVVVGQLLAPKPKLDNAKPQDLNDARSEEGAPIPVVFGTVQVAVNVCDVIAKNARPVTQKVKTSLFSSQTVTLAYDYQAVVQALVCHGPVDEILDVHFGDTVEASGVHTTVTVTSTQFPFTKTVSSVANCSPSLPLSRPGSGLPSALTIDVPEAWGGDGKGGKLAGRIDFHWGTQEQDYNPAVSAAHHMVDGIPFRPRWQGVCYAVFGYYASGWQRFSFGESSTLPQLRLVARRCPSNLGLSGAQTNLAGGANPAEVIYEVLTNRVWGLGFQASTIDRSTFATAGATCAAEGIGVSLALTSQEDASGIVEEVQRYIDGQLLQNPVTGLLELTLNRKDYVEADLPLFDRTNASEIKFTRPSWQGLKNEVKVRFTQFNSANHRPAESTTSPVQDLASQLVSGQVAQETIDFMACTSPSLASSLAVRALRMIGTPLARVSFRTNRQAAGLKVGQPFRVTEPDCGLSAAVFRAAKINYGTFEDGEISVEAVEDIFSFDNPPYTTLTTTLTPSGGVARQTSVRAEEQISRTATTGTLTLVITDTEGQVARVQFSTQSGEAAESGWFDNATVGAYAASVALDAKHPSLIRYQVMGLDAAGAYYAILSGDASFGVDGVAQIEGVPTVTYNGGQAVVQVKADRDTNSLWKAYWNPSTSTWGAAAKIVDDRVGNFTASQNAALQEKWRVAGSTDTTSANLGPWTEVLLDVFVDPTQSKQAPRGEIKKTAETASTVTLQFLGTIGQGGVGPVQVTVEDMNGTVIQAFTNTPHSRTFNKAVAANDGYRYCFRDGGDTSLATDWTPLLIGIQLDTGGFDSVGRPTRIRDAGAGVDVTGADARLGKRLLDTADTAVQLPGSEVTETATRKWAGETGATVGAKAGVNLRRSDSVLLADADVVTALGTSADTAAVAGTAASTVKGDAAAGRSADTDLTGFHTAGSLDRTNKRVNTIYDAARGVAVPGADAALGARILDPADSTKVPATEVNESATRKWAGETGATVGARAGVNLTRNSGALLGDVDVVTGLGTSADTWAVAGRAAGTVRDEALTARKWIAADGQNLLGLNANGQQDEIGAVATGWVNQNGSSIVTTNAGGLAHSGDRYFLIQNNTAQDSFNYKEVALVAGQVYEFTGVVMEFALGAPGGYIVAHAAMLSGVIETFSDDCVAPYVDLPSNGWAVGYPCQPATPVQVWADVRVLFRCVTSGTLRFWLQVGYNTSANAYGAFDDLLLLRVSQAYSRTLKTINSSYRLVDTYRVPQLMNAGRTSVQWNTSGALSYTRGSGTTVNVTVNAFTIRSGTDLNYNAGSCSFSTISATGNNGKPFYVFGYDPGYAGGAVTYFATLNKEDGYADPGYFLVGTGTVPAASTGGSGGGGGGGL